MYLRNSPVVSADYDPRDRQEYSEGRLACKNGRSRDECPYCSGHGTSNGYSLRRHAWMVGHLDAEFARYSEPHGGR